MLESVRYFGVALVNIGNRQRTMDAAVEKHIKELAADIKENGLIHCITLDKEGGLIAGFCRLSAIRLLNEPYYYAGELVPAGFVPYVFTHKTTSKDLQRIELTENLRRKNLTPMDEAKAIANLHDNFEEEHGKDWGRMDTADALKALGKEAASIGTVTSALKIAAYGDDPEVSAAATMKDALKIVEKKEEKQRRQNLGALADISGTNMRVITGSCLDVLPKFMVDSAGSLAFAGIVVDPPYGIDASAFGDQSGINSHEYKDDSAYAMQLIRRIFEEGYSITKPDAHIWMFCDHRHFAHISDVAAKCGWTVFNTPLIWKKSMGHMPWPGYFQRQYECILFARKSDARKLSRVRSDVLDFAAVKDKLHSAEKPGELLHELLSLSFLPGETILDPCCGSGSIFPPAKALSLNVVGIEVDPAMADIARSRIAEG